MILKGTLLALSILLFSFSTSASDWRVESTDTGEFFAISLGKNQLSENGNVFTISALYSNDSMFFILENAEIEKMCLSRIQDQDQYLPDKRLPVRQVNIRFNVFCGNDHKLIFAPENKASSKFIINEFYNNNVVNVGNWELSARGFNERANQVDRYNN